NSASTWSKPWRMAAASASVRIPWRASIRAWTRLPAISCRKRRRSKGKEFWNAATIASKGSWNRPDLACIAILLLSTRPVPAAPPVRPGGPVSPLPPVFRPAAGGNLQGQAEEPDEARRVRLAVDRLGLKGGELGVIQAVGRPAARHLDVPLVELQPHLARHPLLGGGHEGVQGLPQGRVPKPVV